MQPTIPTTSRHRSSPIARLALIGVVAFAAAGIGACSAVSTSSLPSIAVPSITIPSLPAVTGGSPLTACVDSATFGVIQQLKAPGADVQGLLTTNKDVLVNGLQRFQPADPATVAWRDALVAALQSGDMTAAATQVALVTNSQVSLTSC
jgi:hypothetical protein